MNIRLEATRYETSISGKSSNDSGKSGDYSSILSLLPKDVLSTAY